MRYRSPSRRRLQAGALALTAALTLSACDDNPSAPSNIATTQLIAFAGRLQPRAFAWRTIAIDASGTATVQLSSISPQADGIVRLGFGAFENSDCNPSQTIDTASSGTPQISTTVTPGIYCVRVSELGTFTADWSFAITVVVPD